VSIVQWYWLKHSICLSRWDEGQEAIHIPTVVTEYRSLPKAAADNPFVHLKVRLCIVNTKPNHTNGEPNVRHVLPERPFTNLDDSNTLDHWYRCGCACACDPFVSPRPLPPSAALVFAIVWTDMGPLISLSRFMYSFAASFEPRSRR